MWPEHGEQAAPHSPHSQLQALLPQARVAPDLCLFVGFHPSWELASLWQHTPCVMYLWPRFTATCSNSPPRLRGGRAWGSGLTAGHLLCLEQMPGYLLNSQTQTLKRPSSFAGVKVRLPGVDRAWRLLSHPLPSSSWGPASSLRQWYHSVTAQLLAMPAVCQAPWLPGVQREQDRQRPPFLGSHRSSLGGQGPEAGPVVSRCIKCRMVINATEKYKAGAQILSGGQGMCLH